MSTHKNTWGSKILHASRHGQKKIKCFNNVTDATKDNAEIRES